MRAIQEHDPAGRPRAYALAGGVALAAFAVLAVLAGRSAGAGAPDPEFEGRTVAELDFRAEDQPDGAVALREAASGEVVAWIRPGEDGFIRGTLRGLAQARQRGGLGPEEPFRLVRTADGRVALRDDATGRRVTLDAFGPTNAAAFARLIPRTETP